MVKSRYAHIFTLIAAVASFAPVLAVDYLLDSYVRGRERAMLQQSVDSIADRVQTIAYDTITSLRRILADSPSLCTPTFVANTHRQLEVSLYLKQVLVENADGVQYCDALGRQVTFTPLSGDLSVPGHSETIAVVKYGDLAAPALKVTQRFGDSRSVSAFAPVLAATPESLLDGLKATSMVRLTLTNGTEVLTAGDPTAYDKRGSVEFISASAFAGELPLRIEAAVPFAVVRADYADLDVSFTLVACLMSAAFLILALQYVRRGQVPAFDLERAIAAGEIKPHYQPVINLRTGELAGCEVLARWEKKSGEVVAPTAFIDYAEVTGLAIPMTLGLMQQVRSDLSDICREMPDLKISINLFEGHFRDGDIVDDVRAIFGQSPIRFRQLVFEITERRPVEDLVQAQAVIGALHALGCRLAIDDAGTGHSNLAYIHQLGVDVIKIDRMFVDMVKTDTQQVPVLDGLIAMSRDLGTDIVAEGVETEVQAKYLKARGVVLAQGFLFAPALKAGPFKELAKALNQSQAQLEAIEAPAA